MLDAFDLLEGWAYCLYGHSEVVLQGCQVEVTGEQLNRLVVEHF